MSRAGRLLRLWSSRRRLRREIAADLADVRADGADLDKPETDPPIPYGGLGLSSPLTEGPAVLALQVRLAERGFPVEPSGVYDEATAGAVREAKERYRLADPAGTADRATSELLGRLGL